MDAVQLNVRLDRLVKRSGDEALAALGCTPSRAVRALWEYLAVHARLPRAIEHVLRQEDLNEGARSDCSDVRDAGAQLIASFYEQLGLEEPMRPAPDVEALREEWADEQLAEWGLS